MTEIVAQTKDQDSTQVVLLTLADLVADTQNNWSHSVSHEVVEPLAQAITDIVVEGRDALSRFSEREKEASTDMDFWDAIADYREAVEQRVITRISKYLREKRPGDTVSTSFQALLKSLASETEKLPTDMEVAEAREALIRRPGDGLFRRSRKAISRLFSSSGKRRAVPIKILGRYHLLVRLPRAFSRRREEIQFEVALCLTRLETATSKWTHAVLDLEASLDAVAGLVESDLPETPIDEGEATEQTSKIDSKVGERPDVAQVVARVNAAGVEYVDALELAAEEIAGICSPFSQEGLDDLHEFLDYDVKAAGTFLLRPSDRVIPADEFLPITLALEKDAAWIKYQEESRNRIRLNQHLLRTRNTLVKLLESMTTEVFSATVQPLRDVYSEMEDSIRQERADLENLFDHLGDGVEFEDLSKQLRALNEKAVKGIERGADLEGINAADKTLRNLGGSEWERSRRDVDQLPASLEIHAIDFESEMRPSLHARKSSVDLKKIVNNVLGLRFANQLRKPGEQLRRVVVRSWGRAIAVVDVVAYGTDAACDALLHHDGDEVVNEARELAVDGLDRALERTAGGVDSLEEPWVAFNDAAIHVVMNVWNHIHRRVRSDELDTEQWAGLGSRLSVVANTYWLSIERWGRIASAKLTILSRFARRKGSSLVRKGRTAVGASRTTSETGTATMNALRDLENLRSSMPLIYRRLFTFESLNDTSFLENRVGDLSVVKEHFKRWRDGNQASALVISAQLGSGRSSFMNSLGDAAFADADVHTVRFGVRYRSTARVAAVIAKALGVEIPGEADFDRLEQVLGSLSREKPIVCQIYDVEHLVLAAPNGMAVIRDLFVFLARTDHLVYWICGISDLARQFIQRTTTTAGLAEFHALTPYDKKSIEAVIMNRHRRSGLEIRFEPSANPTTLLGQRLKRAKSDDDRQAIVRNAFFERLARFTDQNLRLTLFYWIRSLEFDDAADSVTVRWPKELDFSALSTLDLQREFSLRSFLMHQTLTPEEHNLIYRMPNELGTVILESLLNTGLLTEAQAELYAFDQRIEPGKSYKIHPLLLAPVRKHLVGRHIVY